MRNDGIYLKHILEAIEKVEKYIKHVGDFEGFSKNEMAFDAVIRELEIIGEASNNISNELQKENPDISWRRIIGIGNKLIHECFGVSKKIVWETCQDDLKELKKIVKSLLS